MQRLIFLSATLLLAAPQSSFGGGIGGGGVPPVMHPEVTSLRESSLSGEDIEKQNATELHIERDIESFQQRVAHDLAIAVGTIIPGTLPPAEVDMMFKMQYRE